MKPTTINDRNEITFYFPNDEGSVTFDLFQIVRSMDNESRMKFAEVVGWDNVFDYVIKRLCCETESWDGSDDRSRLELLSKIEDDLLSGYKWGPLQKLDNAAAHMTSEFHIYWKMYHDKQHREFFHKWLEQHGLSSQYGTNNEDYLKFRKLVEDTLEEMKNTKEKNNASSD